MKAIGIVDGVVARESQRTSEFRRCSGTSRPNMATWRRVDLSTSARSLSRGYNEVCHTSSPFNADPGTSTVVIPLPVSHEVSLTEILEKAEPFRPVVLCQLRPVAIFPVSVPLAS